MEEKKLKIEVWKSLGRVMAQNVFSDNPDNISETK